MRGEWLLGFGAASALMVLVGLDLAISVLADRGLTAVRARLTRR